VGSLPGLDITVWAALLLSCPVELAYHVSSSKHVGENEMILLTVGILFVGTISKTAAPSGFFRKRFWVSSLGSMGVNGAIN